MNKQKLIDYKNKLKDEDAKQYYDWAYLNDNPIERECELQTATLLERLSLELEELIYEEDNTEPEPDTEIEVRTYRFTTVMGKCHQNIFNTRLPFLETEAERLNFNSIGYSGKDLYGNKISREEYLNSLGRGKFDVNQIKFDDGDFEEEFIVTWSTIKLP